MIVTLESVSKSFGTQEVLREVSGQIHSQERIGLVGVNGAGKSTLLNIISGDLVADQGVVSRGSGKHFGFLRQDSGLTGGTIQSEMEGVFQPLYDMELEMRQIEDEMGTLNPNSETYAQRSVRYSSLQTQFESAEGYQIHVKIDTVLRGMGFGAVDRSTPVDVLSGGERTRLALCKLLLKSPSLLILDEPTNHLDFDTIVWLEEYLTGYSGALLIVSHDRYFLNTICSEIWELQNNELTRYPGDYEKYLGQKEQRENQLRQEYQHQQEEIARMEDFIARNIVRASTTGRAQSRQKALARMEKIQAPQLPPRPPRIHFTHKRDSVKDVLHIQGLSLSVGEGEEHRVLFSDLDFSMFRGEKIALVGPNGVGKSSLLKAMMNMLPKDSGTIEWGRNTDVSYFDQGTGGMAVEKRAIDQLWDAFPGETEHTIRSTLGHTGLSGEAVFKTVEDLSGGEKARLKFAHFMMECGNVLLMDEPTNHLDLPTKEVLDDALQDYTGTLLVVSHDRYLLNKFPDKIAELHPEGLKIYLGRYDDYREAKQEEKARESHFQALLEQEQAQQKKEEKQRSSYRTREDRRRDAQRRQRLGELEDLIEQWEDIIATLNHEIVQPEIATDYQLMEEKCSQLEDKRHRLDQALEEWAQLAQEQEEIEE